MPSSRIFVSDCINRRSARQGLYVSTLKRSCDVFIASLGLVCLAPIILVVSILVGRKLGRPVIFRQKRPGLNGKLFELIKFRTMTNSLGPDGQLLPDEERVTPLGQFLRSSSLDELPTLWNVVCGEMSLVGPRPFLEEYSSLYTPEQSRRHHVLPGITGLAQVQGRNAISWEDKFRYDLWYVDHLNFWLDLRILVRTLWTTIRREGISAQGSATMPRLVAADCVPSDGSAEQVSRSVDVLKKAA